MVVFHDDPEKYNNPRVLEEIERHVSFLLSYNSSLISHCMLLEAFFRMSYDPVNDFPLSFSVDRTQCENR